MHGVLPTVESGKPVKQQVEGLLAFAQALHRHQRKNAKFRARRWSRAFPHGADADAVLGDEVLPRHSILPAQGEPSREVQPRGGDEDLPTGVDSDGSSDEELALRKKGTGRNLPKLSPSIRANKLQLAEELLGEEDLSLAEAQVLVEKYRKRNRAAEAAVQASVERFHRGRKQQEPLLDDLKTLKKVIADKNRHLHLLEGFGGLGIRQLIKHKASHWDDGTRGSSRSSARTPPEWQPISKKSGDERRPSFTRSRDVDVWSLRTNSKDSTGRRQAESPEFSPEEEEQRLLAMAQDLASKELAQSLRLRRSPIGMRPKGVEQKNRDWLHGLQRKRQKSGAAHDLTLQVPRHRLQRAPRCLQPLSEKDLATRRIGNVVFWHSSAWPSSLRRVAKAKEGHGITLEEVLEPSLQHPFVIGERKQADEVRTLRLEEAEVPSSPSSSSSSSVSPKEKLAKSCLKPWRSPVEAYLGKSFIFPQRRGSARASELLGTSMQKSGSQRTLEKGPVAPAVHEEEAEATATSRSAWEKIKRTHGFAALCHAHPRNDR